MPLGWATCRLQTVPLSEVSRIPQILIVGLYMHKPIDVTQATYSSRIHLTNLTVCISNLQEMIATAPNSQAADGLARCLKALQISQQRGIEFPRVATVKVNRTAKLPETTIEQIDFQASLTTNPSGKRSLRSVSIENQFDEVR